MTTICCVGEAMIEMIVEEGGDNARLGVAGDVLNSAIYLRRAGIGAVRFVTALGQDGFSDRVAGFVTSHGLDGGSIRRDATRNVGLYAIETDAAGERSFQYWRSHSAARQMFGPDDAPDFAALDGAGVIYLSAITLAILSPAIRRGLMDRLVELRRDDVRVAFDSNYRPRLWEDADTARAVIGEMWGLTDIGFPSIDDEMALFEQDAATATDRLRAYGMDTCVLKRGAAGPRLLSGSAPEDYAPAGQVVDTTGAGDSFNGTFLGHWLAGAQIETALTAAHDMACAVVGVRGAILPDAPGR